MFIDAINARKLGLAIYAGLIVAVVAGPLLQRSRISFGLSITENLDQSFYLGGLSGSPEFGQRRCLGGRQRQANQTLDDVLHEYQYDELGRLTAVKKRSVT